MFTERTPIYHFKAILGRYCSINQFVELSNRCFLNEHKSEIENRESLKALSTRYKIALTAYDANRMISEINRSYIVNVQLCFETFLKHMIAYLKRYGSVEYSPRLDEESYLSCVVRNIYGKERPEEVEKRYKLCEYYRLVRNSTVHDLFEIKIPKVEFSELRKYTYELTVSNFERKEEKKICRQLDAPNEYDKITYDDFLLFSKTSLELATMIFDSFPWDYVKTVVSIPNEILRNWKNDTDSRMEKALQKFLAMHYGLKAPVFEYDIEKKLDEKEMKELEEKKEEFDKKKSEFESLLKSLRSLCRNILIVDEIPEDVLTAWKKDENVDFRKVLRKYFKGKHSGKCCEFEDQLECLIDRLNRRIAEMK